MKRALLIGAGVVVGACVVAVAAIYASVVIDNVHPNDADFAPTPSGGRSVSNHRDWSGD